MNLRTEFKTMHQADPHLLIPNAWDLQSAMIFEHVGFSAVATTSWGMSNSLGYADGEKITFSQLETIVKNMMQKLTIPLSVDIERGYSEDIEEITKNVISLAELGVAGINIEDSLASSTLKDINKQSKLISNIRNALEQRNYNDFFINARTDTYFLVDNPLEETLARGEAYLKNGADGIFVPGLSSYDEIRVITETLDGPINLMSLPNLNDFKEIKKLGVKRFSIANALSDQVISFIQQQAAMLFSSQNTKHLYKNSRHNIKF